MTGGNEYAGTPVFALRHGISCVCCVFSFSGPLIVEYAKSCPKLANNKRPFKRPLWLKKMAKRLGVNR